MEGFTSINRPAFNFLSSPQPINPIIRKYQQVWKSVAMHGGRSKTAPTNIGRLETLGESDKLFPGDLPGIDISSYIRLYRHFNRCIVAIQDTSALIG